MPRADHFSSKFASDVEAFYGTLDMPTCHRDTLYPSQSMRWGLAATSHAHHLWHIDCNGFATVIKVKTGLKWWVVGRPKSSSTFSSISCYLDNYELDSINDSKWDLEAILLLPGSTLYVSLVCTLEYGFY